MYLLDSIWASIREMFFKIQIWHLQTSNMHALNYCHIVKELSICISLLMHVCISVDACVCKYIYMCVCVCCIWTVKCIDYVVVLSNIRFFES